MSAGFRLSVFELAEVLCKSVSLGEPKLDQALMGDSMVHAGCPDASEWPYDGKELVGEPMEASRERGTLLEEGRGGGAVLAAGGQCLDSCSQSLSPES